VFGGLDLGATKILSLVIDAEGNVLGRDNRPTLGAGGPDAVIARMIDSLREALHQGGVAPERLAAVGASAPGPIDIERGVVTHPPNLPGWHDVALADRLCAEFEPRLLENDANRGRRGAPVWGGSAHAFVT
jgi:glucokinase